MDKGVNGLSVALVTGASSGIGYAYARELAGRGYDLLLVSNERERIVETAAQLAAQYGIAAEGLYCDLSRPEAARELHGWCGERGIVVEILINNAGVFFFNDVADVAAGRLEVMVNLHVATVTLMCHYFGADMARRGKGYILNMSSLAAKFPFPGISVYSATKSYVRTFSKAIHNELYDKGVRVTAVCPGGVATGLYNLRPELLRLGVRLGVLMTPERLARKGLRAMFAGRRCVMPGWINHLFAPLAGCVPSWLVRLVKRKASFYRYGK